MGPPRTRAARLLLVRHGEVEAWARDRIYGRLDPSLSPAGRAQARALAPRIAEEGPVALYVSPSRRAQESATPIVEATTLSPSIDPRLREIEFGEFEGLTFAEAEAREPAVWRAWMERPGSVRFPGGECWDDVRARAVAAGEAIARTHPGEAAIVVAHGGVIRALLAEALGLSAERTFRVEVGFGSLTILRREPFGWMVETLSWRP